MRITTTVEQGDYIVQVWIEIDENENCGYFPTQVFEARGEESVAESVVVDQSGLHEVIGWQDGAPFPVRVVPVGDSGAGQSTLVYGGNNGIRMRQAGSDDAWSEDSGDQIGEPYLLLAEGANVSQM